MLVRIGAATAPEETLRALREIDAAADLVHLQGYEWLLGVKAPNPAAREKVELELKRIEKAARSFGGGAMIDPADKARIQSDLGKEFQLLQYCAQGFRPIQLYNIDNRQWTFRQVVEDFRLRDFNWRTRREAAFAELKDEVSLEAGNKRRAGILREYFDQEGGSLFHKVMRRAKSFLMPRRAAQSPSTP